MQEEEMPVQQCRQNGIKFIRQVNTSELLNQKNHDCRTVVFSTTIFLRISCYVSNNADRETNSKFCAHDLFCLFR